MTADRLVVTGPTGFLGRHLMPILCRQYGPAAVVGLTSRDYDLMEPVQVRRMFAEQQPDVLVHLAAYSGGIGANREYPKVKIFDVARLKDLGLSCATPVDRGLRWTRDWLARNYSARTDGIRL